MDTFEFLARGAEAFIGVFNAGGKTFVGFVTGILPTLIVLLTAVYTLIGLVGATREKFKCIHGESPFFFINRSVVRRIRTSANA